MKWIPIGDQAERVSPHFHVLLQLVSHLMKTVFYMDTHMQTIDEA